MNSFLAKSKYLFKSINLLNMLLAAVLIVMADYTVLPLMNANISFRLPFHKKPVEVKKQETRAEQSLPSLSDYIIVGEENLFHPQRKIPAEKTAEEKPVPKPEFVLYGTLIANNTSLAYLEDLKAPKTTPGRGTRQIVLKKGDALSGYTLKEIDPDKVVMVRGEDKMTVLVIEPGKPKARGEAVPVRQESHTQQPKALKRTPSGVPRQFPSARSLIHKPTFPKKRAHMTPAEERARQFFTK
jgi:hypothetical protein